MRCDILLYAIVCYLIFEYNRFFQPKTVSLLHGPGLSMLGIAVSIFVAFRNTQAINRWWEGRILWGAITNGSRHWRDSLQALLGPETELPGSALAQTKQSLLELQVLQVWLLNFELRNYWRLDARDAVDGLCHTMKLPVSIGLQETMKLRASGIGNLHRTKFISDWGCDALLRCTETMTNALGVFRGSGIRHCLLPMTSLFDWFAGYLDLLFISIFWRLGSPSLGCCSSWALSLQNDWAPMWRDPLIMMAAVSVCQWIGSVSTSAGISSARAIPSPSCRAPMIPAAGAKPALKDYGEYQNTQRRCRGSSSQPWSW